ncbi:MAG TPA: hypothetical protein VF898_07380 [Chloroflexota bacterium]
MKVDYLLLADAVAAADGKHYIHGGGWDTLYVPSFPFTHPQLSIAARLRVPAADTNVPHTIGLDVVGEDGTTILANPVQAAMTVGRPPNIPPAQDQVIPLALNIVALSFSRPGTYSLIFMIDGEQVDAAQFHVLRAPAQAQAQGLPGPPNRRSN